MYRNEPDASGPPTPVLRSVLPVQLSRGQGTLAARGKMISTCRGSVLFAGAEIGRCEKG